MDQSAALHFQRAKAPPAPRSRSWWGLVWWRFRQNRIGVFGLIVIIVLAAGGLFAPILTPFDPDKVELADEFRLQAPSATHLFGTDNLGRDLFARTLYGTRVSLLVAFSATAVSISIGVLAGALAGFYGGIVDGMLMRVVDVLLSVPTFFVIVILQSVVESPGIGNVILFIGITRWMTTARVVRGQILVEREKEYVLAARSIGASGSWIVFRHVMPNIMPVVIVAASLQIGSAILLEASLSYLGFGVQLPTASWGSMLNESRRFLTTGFWMAIYPGIFLCVTVLAFNFVGDGIAAALNPVKGR
jgi:peptide/nickel transport system permease protein